MKYGNRILITGASGYIGRAFRKQYRNDEIIGLYSSQPFKGGRRFDALNDALDDVIESPRTISHCVILHAWVSIDKCAENPIAARAVNVTSVLRTIDWCVKHKVVPVFVSSEAVFDNNDEFPPDESLMPRPYTLYGKMKLEVEHYLRDTNIEHAIIRIARVVGDSADDRTGFKDWFKAFDKGGIIRCANDQIMSPLSISDAVHSLMLVVKKNLRGVYHLAGDGMIRRIDLLRMLIREYSKIYLCEVTVEECQLADFKVIERRSLNSSISNLKFKKTTGFQPISYLKLCRKLI
jgi:dTDP-4-dehydrorhamnose reductase